MRVTGLDLSLASTGWAMVTDRQVEVGRITSKPAGAHLNDRSTRLRTITQRVWNHAAAADLVVIESPTYSGKTTGHMHDRSGLWWLVTARLTGAGIPTIEVELHTLKIFATGKGNTDKDGVLLAAARTFPQVPITGNDEADALWLAALGARYLGHPIDPWPRDLPRDRARALDKLTGLTPCPTR